EQVATASRLRPMHLDEVLDWVGDALGRVHREVFFERFNIDGAIQYFYEPFLAAFDPELRRQLGIWYTPRDVVAYQVARVHELLRTRFDLPAGLADERVFVLDPAVGTGSYVVEVLRTIETALRRLSDDALVANEVKHAAIQRVFGFELLPAPFVVAHLQV